MKHEHVKSDITVIGGGLAGVSAAVAAARLGRTVSLVQNRPVLGGNSSSEVRVWVVGATAHGVHRFARETGIMGEMFVENQFVNPDGNPYLWDTVVLETVLAEPNIRLFLNTDVHEVEADGDEENRMIRSVTGWMMGSERRIRFESEMYLDCSGDGLIGFLAGAKYRLGREAKHEFHEEWAPETADEIALGSTILFYTKDVGHPVKFVPPSFAKDITQTNIPMNRVIRSGDSGCHYWWIEWGGELDTVHDNERIRDELWAVIYGIWDYIKNSGKFEADNMTLEWVGSIPGKREYRRFVGDYILNQNDIVAQREFADRVAFGGWSIDLHPPQGMYATESGSKHLHVDGVYHIPFRSLYSINVNNLMFAGRNMSATHVAFGTTRVMATCAVMGEAAGTGAAVALRHKTTPRGVYQNYLQELQQTLLKQDASVIGIHNMDPDDLARNAVVRASSTLRKVAIEPSRNGEPTQMYKLDRDIAVLFPVTKSLERLDFFVDAAEKTTLRVDVWSTGKPQNYVPHEREASGAVEVAPGSGQWVSVPVQWTPGSSQNAFVILHANPHLHLHMSNEPLTGVLGFERSSVGRAVKQLEDHQVDQPVVQWNMKNFVRKPICFRVLPETAAYCPENVTNGWHRPYGGPNVWVSEPLDKAEEAWIELEWEAPVTVKEIHLTFNDDVNEDLINLHHHKTPFDAIPELVRDYRIEALFDGSWQLLQRVEANRKRKRVHQLDIAVKATKIRCVVEATNGCPRAEIIEIRVY